jgi:predicted secreted protein
MRKKQLIVTLLLGFLIGVITTVSFASGVPERYKPVQEIKANVEEEFIITLAANRSDGAKWELIEPLNEKFVKVVHWAYRENENGRAGTGKEEWTFRTLGSGRTKFSLRCVQPGEKGIVTVQERAFELAITKEAAQGN